MAIIEILIAAISAFITYLVYYWKKRTLSYWEDRGVKGPKPLPFVGNFGKVLTLKENMDILLWNMYKSYAKEQAVGFYMGYRPALLVRDPEMLKRVLVKDFTLFQDRGIKNLGDDKFSENLFNAEEETWRVLRAKLSPIFTSGKLKTMIPLIKKCIDDYMVYVENIIDREGDHEIRDLVGKYNLEVIGTCAFGVDMNAFTDAHNPFYEAAGRLFTPSFLRKTLQALDFFIPNFASIVDKFVSIGDPELKKFFMRLVHEIVEEREGKKKIRNDFMDLMIELKEQGKVEKRDSNWTSELEIDDEIIAAQALIFFAGGFDTSSGIMSFMMLELSYNEEIQQRLYEEIKEVTERHNQKITYENIKEMTYLNMCFDETLRKYPVVGTLFRKCSENYIIPDTRYKLEKDMKVFISVLGLHRDPKFYKNPEVFDPERFSPENKQKIPRYAYLPFGEGPRNCIGMRLGKVQSMMGMASFLRKFKLEKSHKTPTTLHFDPLGLTLTSKEGIWLKISRRVT